MTMMWNMARIVGGIALCAPLLAAAQTAAPQSAVAQSAGTQPLPATPLAASPAPMAAPLDAAQRAGLPAATRIAGALLPPGTYRQMMSGTFDKMMSSMASQMTEIPVREYVKAAGLDDEKTATLGPGSLREVMTIMDPYFHERMDKGMKAMMGIIVDMMDRYEPAVREGLAEAYARRFTPAQLADIERFFATPTGSAYAGQSMLIYADPAVMDRMMAMMPEMMKQGPRMVAAMSDATKDLPKARTYKDLTKAERAQLAALLGADPKKMK